MSDSAITPPRQSSAVTALAVVNYLLGTARIAVGVIAMWFLLNLLIEGPGNNPDLLKLLGFLMLAILWPVLALLALISIGAGVLLIIAGMGLRRRRSSARTLTLVLGALGGMLAALYGLQLLDAVTGEGVILDELAVSIVGMAIHGSYCAFVFIVLLNRNNAAEFS